MTAMQSLMSNICAACFCAVVVRRQHDGSAIARAVVQKHAAETPKHHQAQRNPAQAHIPVRHSFLTALAPEVEELVKLP